MSDDLDLKLSADVSKWEAAFKKAAVVVDGLRKAVVAGEKAIEATVRETEAKVDAIYETGVRKRKALLGDWADAHKRIQAKIGTLATSATATRNRLMEQAERVTVRIEKQRLAAMETAVSKGETLERKLVSVKKKSVDTQTDLNRKLIASTKAMNSALEKSWGALASEANSASLKIVAATRKVNEATFGKFQKSVGGAVDALKKASLDADAVLAGTRARLAGVAAAARSGGPISRVGGLARTIQTFDPVDSAKLKADLARMDAAAEKAFQGIENSVVKMRKKVEGEVGKFSTDVAKISTRLNKANADADALLAKMQARVAQAGSRLNGPARAVGPIESAMRAERIASQPIGQRAPTTLSQTFDPRERAKLLSDLEKIDKPLKAAGKEAERFGSIFDRMGKRIHAAAARLGATLLLLGGVRWAGAGLDFAKEFQTELGRLEQVLNKTGPGIDKYKDRILELSTQTSSSIIDLTKGLALAIGTLPKATAEGVPIDQFKAGFDILEASTRAARISGATTEEVIKGITAVLNVYGKTGITASDITDKMFATFDQGGATIAQLSQSMGGIVGIAEQAGVGLDELLGEVAVLTRVNGSASKSITNLRQAIVTITNPPKLVRDRIEVLNQTMADMGKSARLNFGSAALASKGLRGILQDIVDVGGQKELALLFTDVQGRNAAATLLGANLKTVNNDIKGVTESTGRAAEGWEKIKNNFEEVAGVTRNKLEVVLSDLGDKTVPMLTANLKELGDWLIINRDSLAAGLEKLVKALSWLGEFIASNGGKILAFFAAVYAGSLVNKLELSVATAVNSLKGLTTVVGEAGVTAGDAFAKGFSGKGFSGQMARFGSLFVSTLKSAFSASAIVGIGYQIADYLVGGMIDFIQRNELKDFAEGAVNMAARKAKQVADLRKLGLDEDSQAKAEAAFLRGETLSTTPGGRGAPRTKRAIGGGKFEEAGDLTLEQAVLADPKAAIQQARDAQQTLIKIAKEKVAEIVEAEGKYQESLAKTAQAQKIVDHFTKSGMTDRSGSVEVAKEEIAAQEKVRGALAATIDEKKELAAVVQRSAAMSVDNVQAMIEEVKFAKLSAVEQEALQKRQREALAKQDKDQNDYKSSVLLSQEEISKANKQDLADERDRINKRLDLFARTEEAVEEARDKVLAFGAVNGKVAKEMQDAYEEATRALAAAEQVAVNIQSTASGKWKNIAEERQALIESLGDIEIKTAQEVAAVQIAETTRSAGSRRKVAVKLIDDINDIQIKVLKKGEELLVSALDRFKALVKGGMENFQAGVDEVAEAAAQRALDANRAIQKLTEGSSEGLATGFLQDPKKKGRKKKEFDDLAAELAVFKINLEARRAFLNEQIALIEAEGEATRKGVEERRATLVEGLKHEEEVQAKRIEILKETEASPDKIIEAERRLAATKEANFTAEAKHELELADLKLKVSNDNLFTQNRLIDLIEETAGVELKYIRDVADREKREKDKSAAEKVLIEKKAIEELRSYEIHAAIDIAVAKRQISEEQGNVEREQERTKHAAELAALAAQAGATERAKQRFVEISTAVNDVKNAFEKAYPLGKFSGLTDAVVQIFGVAGSGFEESVRRAAMDFANVWDEKVSLFPAKVRDAAIAASDQVFGRDAVADDPRTKDIDESVTEVRGIIGQFVDATTKLVIDLAAVLADPFSQPLTRLFGAMVGFTKGLTDALLTPLKTMLGPLGETVAGIVGPVLDLPFKLADVFIDKVIGPLEAALSGPFDRLFGGITEGLGKLAETEKEIQITEQTSASQRTSDARGGIRRPAAPTASRTRRSTRTTGRRRTVKDPYSRTTTGTSSTRTTGASQGTSSSQSEKTTERVAISTATALKETRELIERSVKGAVVLAERLAEVLPQVAGEIMKMLVRILPDLIRKLAEAMAGIIKVLADNIGPLLEGVLGAIIDSLPVIMQAIGEALPKVFDALLNGILQVAKALPEIIDSLLQAVAAALPGILDSLAKTLPKLIVAFFEGAGDMLGIVAENAAEITDALVEGAATIVEELIAHGPEIFVAFHEAVIKLLTSPDLYVALARMFYSVTVKLPFLIVKAIVDGLTQAADKIAFAMSHVVPEIAEAVVQGIRDGGQWLVDELGKVFDKIIDFLTGGDVGDSIGGAFAALGGKSSPANRRKNKEAAPFVERARASQTPAERDAAVAELYRVYGESGIPYIAGRTGISVDEIRRILGLAPIAAGAYGSSSSRRFHLGGAVRAEAAAPFAALAMLGAGAQSFGTGGMVFPQSSPHLMAAQAGMRQVLGSHDVAAVLQAGEGVVSRPGMDVLGEDGLARLNRGQEIGGRLPAPVVQFIGRPDVRAMMSLVLGAVAVDVGKPGGAVRRAVTRLGQAPIMASFVKR